MCLCVVPASFFCINLFFSCRPTSSLDTFTTCTTFASYCISIQFMFYWLPFPANYRQWVTCIALPYKNKLIWKPNNRPGCYAIQSLKINHISVYYQSQSNTHVETKLTEQPAIHEYEMPGGCTCVCGCGCACVCAVFVISGGRRRRQT